MILKNPLPFNPWPNATFEEIQKIDTAPEMPAVNNRNKVVLRDMWQPPPPQEWTPPPYWRNLLHMDESKFEQECKKWFARAMVVIILVSIFLLSSMFLFKLIMLVADLK